MQVQVLTRLVSYPMTRIAMMMSRAMLLCPYLYNDVNILIHLTRMASFVETRIFLFMSRLNDKEQAQHNKNLAALDFCKLRIIKASLRPRFIVICQNPSHRPAACLSKLASACRQRDAYLESRRSLGLTPRANPCRSSFSTLLCVWKKIPLKVYSVTQRSSLGFCI